MPVIPQLLMPSSRIVSERQLAVSGFFASRTESAPAEPKSSSRDTVQSERPERSDVSDTRAARQDEDEDEDNRAASEDADFSAVLNAAIIAQNAVPKVSIPAAENRNSSKVTGQVSAEFVGTNKGSVLPSQFTQGTTQGSSHTGELQQNSLVDATGRLPNPDARQTTGAPVIEASGNQLQDAGISAVDAALNKVQPVGVAGASGDSESAGQSALAGQSARSVAESAANKNPVVGAGDNSETAIAAANSVNPDLRTESDADGGYVRKVNAGQQPVPVEEPEIGVDRFRSSGKQLGASRLLTSQSSASDASNLSVSVVSSESGLQRSPGEAGVVSGNEGRIRGADGTDLSSGSIETELISVNSAAPAASSGEFSGDGKPFEFSKPEPETAAVLAGAVSSAPLPKDVPVISTPNPSANDFGTTAASSGTQSGAGTTAGISDLVAAETRLPLTAQVSRAVYEHIQRQGAGATGDGSKMTLRLDPPTLGELVISLSKTAEGIAVRVTAREPVTMDMLLVRGAEIETHLKSQELNLSGIEFLAADFSQGQSEHSSRRDQFAEAGESADRIRPTQGKTGRVARVSSAAQPSVPLPQSDGAVSVRA